MTEDLVDRNGGNGSILPLISAGRLTALMPASWGPALVVTHLQVRSSSRHPLLGTGSLSGRSRILRTVPVSAVTVH
jgi:hypothetical protein